MKVTAGIYKGRNIKNPQYEHLRATSDIVKQALFNKIYEKIEGAKVLDLFCGTGALGIEALSRGASEVVFADKNFKSYNLTKENLKSLEIDARVIKLPYEKTLQMLSGEKFDIILLDPPYMAGLYENCMSLIEKFDLLEENGIIVCEHDKTTRLEISNFLLVDEKVYGIKKLSYYVKRWL